VLHRGGSGQSLGLSVGDPPNPPCGRRGRTGAGEVGVGFALASLRSLALARARTPRA
jgi:hypothetical protein